QAALDRWRTGGTHGLAWTNTAHDGVVIWTGAPTKESSGGADKPRSYALVKGSVVLASSADLINLIIDTSRGRRQSLKDAKGYQSVTGRLPSDVLVRPYANPAAAAPIIRRQRSTGGAAAALQNLEAYRAAGAVLLARSGGLEADGWVDVDPSKLDPGLRPAFTAPARANGLIRDVPP